MENIPKHYTCQHMLNMIFTNLSKILYKCNPTCANKVISITCIYYRDHHEVLQRSESALLPL